MMSGRVAPTVAPKARGKSNHHLLAATMSADMDASPMTSPALGHYRAVSSSALLSRAPSSSWRSWARSSDPIISRSSLQIEMIEGDTGEKNGEDENQQMKTVRRREGDDPPVPKTPMQSDFFVEPTIATTPAINEGGCGETTVPVVNTEQIRSLKDLLLSSRPTYHDDASYLKGRVAVDEQLESAAGKKLGMWDGVVCRNLTQILGGIMFLRLGVVFGQAGVGLGTILYTIGILLDYRNRILGCSVITVTTTCSLSSIATNGTPHAGGIYFMISRSLGPKFGGAIGILIFLSNAADVAIFIVAFSETVVAQAQTTAPGFHVTGWDVQLIGMTAFIVLCVIVFSGIDLVVKAQVILLLVMLTSIISVYIGAFISPPNPSIGFLGVSRDLLALNFLPDFSPRQSFFTMLTLFFPAVTGFTAATSVYGELKDPEKSLPRGTLISLLISTITYIVSGWILGASCSRQAGLIAHPAIMVDVSISAPLVYLGIYSSTLSSALIPLVSGPRVLTALASDRLFPPINAIVDALTPRRAVFLRPNRPPIAPMILFAILASIGILIGHLNSNAALSSGSNLLAFMLINYACFATEISADPGWRPTFKFSNQWVSLCGFASCALAMILVSPFASIAALFIGGILYKYLSYGNRAAVAAVDWGSARDAVSFVTAITSVKQLCRVRKSIRTYRPNLLVMCGRIAERPHLLQAANLLRKGNGIMSYANVLGVDSGEHSRNDLLRLYTSFPSERKAMEDQLLQAKIKGFAQIVIAPTLSGGINSLIMSSGLTKHLRPNVVVLGWRAFWRSRGSDCHAPAREFVEMLQEIMALDMGIVLIANAKNLDLSVPSSGDLQYLDIWWLYDDGGLTVLMGHLLSKAREFRRMNITLRMMTVVASKSGREAARMVGLLNHFRIEADIVAISVPLTLFGDYQPSPSSLSLFTSISRGLHADKTTLRLLTICDLISLYCSGVRTRLVVVTIPVPNVLIDPVRYMSWMTCLTLATNHTTLLMRGNQTTVLEANL